MICSPCCAIERGRECPPCAHHEASTRYAEERHKKAGDAGVLGKHFVALLDENLDAEVDDALDMLESGKDEEARPVIERLHHEHPAYHTTNYAMGAALIKAGKPEEAIPYFKKAVEIFPYFAEAHFNLAHCHNRLLDIPNYIKSLQDVVRIGGGDLVIVGHAKETLDELSRTIKTTDGVDLDTYVEHAGLFDKAHALMCEKRFEEALGLFKLIVGKNPRHHQSWGNMGICLAMLGRKRLAIDAYDKALEAHPGYELAANNKIIAERMEEGVPPKAPDGKEVAFQSVNYSAIEYAADVATDGRAMPSQDKYSGIKKLAGKILRF